MELPADLRAAITEGDAARVRAMLRERPHLVRAAGEHQKTALHWAAELNRADIAALLLEAGSDIEARTSWGATPFDWAATMGSNAVADLLLEAGATGLTLITAAATGRHGVVRAFVESGADLSGHRRRDAPPVADREWPPDSAHIRGEVLSDALYAAARNGQHEIVEYLLERGADVDARGFFGAPALHWAAINGHREVVSLLLSRGANPRLRDSRFDSDAEGWAREGGHDGIAEVLQTG